jgi:hypothetical protein
MTYAEATVLTFRPKCVCQRPISTGIVLVLVNRFAVRKSWMML